MDPLFRALILYLFLLAIFRIFGNRSLAQTTTFDLLLLLIVGEATQQALLGEDYSVTNALVIISVLVGIDMLLAKLKDRFPWVEKLLEGAPLILVAHGKLLPERMAKAGVDENDVLAAARINHGLERLDDVKYAVQERDGTISIIPRKRQA